VASLRAAAAKLGLPYYEISSITGQGIEGLKYDMAQFLAKVVEEKVEQEK
jgi:hypothetical protein